MGGFFNHKKTVSVASVVYNLAGDRKPVNFLQTVIMGAIMRSVPSLGGAIAQSYQAGPGLKLRSFGRWAETSGYLNMVTQLDSNLVVTAPINRVALAAAIPPVSGHEIQVQASEIGTADYAWWVEQYMSIHHPALRATDYLADFDESSNTITIRFAASVGQPDISFEPVGYDPAARYLYARYIEAENPSEGALEPGEDEVVEEPPDTEEWDLVSSDESEPEELTLTTTTTTLITYSDDTPEETDEVVVEDEIEATELVEVYGRTVYNGGNSLTGQITSTRSVMTLTTGYEVVQESTTEESTETLPGDVIKTTTITTVTDVIVPVYTVRIDTQTLVHKSLSTPKILIYKQGSGSAAYDAFFSLAESSGGFFPYVPLRINNVFISPTFHDDVYQASKKAVKRALGRNTSFDTLIDKLGDNESIGQIDYAYLVFGVALNNQDYSAKRYLYEFFQESMLGKGLSNAAFAAWREEFNAAVASEQAHREWVTSQWTPDGPLFSEPEPEVLPIPDLPEASIEIKSDGSKGFNYNMTLSWISIEETVGSGVRPGAKKGQIWFEVVGTEAFTRYVETFYSAESQGDIWTMEPRTEIFEHIRFWWQDGDNSWRRLDIWGLRHQNQIYGGKSVVITAAEALGDSDASGFIVPLHREIYKRTPLVHSTQMAGSCCLLVLNCYQVHKQRWYETDYFKIILIVAIVVITIATGGFGASSIGLLGTNAGVGAALGFTGTAAIIAGAVANAIAAMILTQIITMASTAMFGDKVGTVVAIIASFIAINAGTALSNGGSMASMFDQMTRAESLLQLTVAAGNGYAAFMKAEAQEMMLRTQQITSDYTKQSEEISAKFAELLGIDNTSVIDPMMLTDSSRSVMAEPAESFVGRTLMVGSDIAELTNGLLSEFTSVTTTTDLPV